MLAVANDMDTGLELYDDQGRRKYLTSSEQLHFLKQLKLCDDQTRLFGAVLTMTGCRVSEALELTPQQLDAANISIVFRTLKRRRLTFRAVPIPPTLMRDLVALKWTMQRDTRIWSFSRQKAWLTIKDTMRAARIEGPHASPKGLRHGFGIACAEKNIPLALIQRWMGHANLETTIIYQQAVGQEERAFAKRLWSDYTRL